MAEQLDRLDVRVAVDDAAGHHRARIGLLLRDTAEAGHEIDQKPDIADQPHDERQRQPPVGRSDDEQRTEEIDQHVVEHVDQLDHAFAHGERSLHQLGSDAARELVLIERHRLLQQIAVHLPADSHGVVAHQRLVLQQRVEPDRSRQDHHDHERHGAQLPAFRLEKRLPILRRKPVDDRTEEAEHPHLGECDDGDQQRIEGDVWPRPSREVHTEAEQRLRRLHRLVGRKRIKSLFKPAKHDLAAFLSALPVPFAGSGAGNRRRDERRFERPRPGRFRRMVRLVRTTTTIGLLRAGAKCGRECC